jgi:hypothetical protein
MSSLFVEDYSEGEEGGRGKKGLPDLLLRVQERDRRRAAKKEEIRQQ